GWRRGVACACVLWWGGGDGVEVGRGSGGYAMQAASLVLDRPGYWKHNRIAWAGPSLVPPELAALVSGLRGALAKSRIAFDTKPFVSHVTLLRDGREPRAIPELAPIEWRLAGFALVQSVTLPRGSRYEVRRSWSA